MKKIILLFILIFSFSNIYAEDNTTPSSSSDSDKELYQGNNIENSDLNKEENYEIKISNAKQNINSDDIEVAKDAAAILYDDSKKMYSEYSSVLSNCKGDSVCESNVKSFYAEEGVSAEEQLENSREQLKEKERDYANSSEGSADLTSFGFKISTSDLTPGQIGGNISGKDFEEKGNFVLGTIIQSLMMALGGLSVLIMTIGGGYIILNNGQDELLNKGKAIFMSGVYAMIIALSSYVVVAMVRFILYSNTN